MEHLGWGIFPKRRADLQAVLVAQLHAELFLLLEQRHSFPEPASGFQDPGLAAVAPLQTVLVAQLQAERFLLLEQRHGCPKPTPGFRLWKDLTDGSISDKILSSIRTALISIRSFSFEQNSRFGCVVSGVPFQSALPRLANQCCGRSEGVELRCRLRKLATQKVLR